MGSLRDVDIRQLLELVVHAGKLLLDVFGGVRNSFLDPGDVEEYAAVRAPASFAHFSPDAARHVIARQQFGRAAGVLVALRISPAFLFVVGGLSRVVRRNFIEHEPAPFLIPEHASFAANAFRDQNAADARRPDHSCRMELHEFHVLQRRSRVDTQAQWPSPVYSQLLLVIL